MARLDLLHAEMIRAAERTLDQQLHAAAELDDKSEQMITLALATIGGEVAAFAYLSDRGPPRLGADAVFGAAILLAVVALGAFLDAYLGVVRRGRIEAGPDIAALARVANDPGWTPDRHALSLLEGYASYFATNTRIMESSSRSRRVGLAALAASSLASGGAAIYVLAGAIPW